MLDLRMIYGDVDGVELYRFKGCKRFFGTAKGTLVYLREEDGTFTKTQYRYYDRCVPTYSNDFTSCVVDRNRITVYGHSFERHNNGREEIVTVDGVVCKAHPYNGWRGERELIENDKDFSALISKLPDTVDLNEFRDEPHEDKDETLFFVKYNGCVAIIGHHILYFDSVLPENADGSNIACQGRGFEELLMAIRDKLFFGGRDRTVGCIDKSSFVDILAIDKAYCFTEMEKIVNASPSNLNFSDLTRRLGLGRDTTYKLNKRLKSDPDDKKSQEKLSMYKMCYGYMKATLTYFDK